jgi:hypothetical protein
LRALYLLLAATAISLTACSTPAPYEFRFFAGTHNCGNGSLGVFFATLPPATSIDEEANVKIIAPNGDEVAKGFVGILGWDDKCKGIQSGAYEAVVTKKGQTYSQIVSVDTSKILSPFTTVNVLQANLAAVEVEWQPVTNAVAYSAVLWDWDGSQRKTGKFKAATGSSVAFTPTDMPLILSRIYNVSLLALSEELGSHKLSHQVNTSGFETNTFTLSN